MAKNLNKKMTFDEALQILRNDIQNRTWGEIQEAVRIVREQDPNNALLNDFESRLKDFDRGYNLDEKNLSVYENNSRELDGLSQSYSYDKFLSAKANSDIKGFVDRTAVVDGKGANQKALSKEEKNKYLSLLFEGAKMQAETSLAGDSRFAKMNKTAQAKAYKNEVRNIFFVNFAQTAVSSRLSAPKKAEQRIGSPEYKNYITNQARKAANAFNNIVAGNERIIVKTDAVLSSCADTARLVENYVKGLRDKARQYTEQTADKIKTGAAHTARKGKESAQNIIESAGNGFTKLANKFQEKKNKLEQTANFISKNRYAIWKNIKGSFNDNKFKLIGNVAANAAFGYYTAAAAATAAAGAAAPVLVPALAAYAAYHAAGAWVFPVIAEMRRINRQRREAGEPALHFKEALKQAWKNKTAHGKERRRYLIGGLLNTGLAFGGLSLLKDGLEAADSARLLAGGAKEGLNVTLAASIADTRHAISLGRAGTATLAQLADASIAYALYAKDSDNELKKHEFKQAAVAAMTGLGFNMAFQLEQSLLHTPDNLTADYAAMPKSGLDGQLPADTLAKADSFPAIDTADVALPQTEAVPVPVAEPKIELFPSRFTSEEEMGITKSQFDILTRTTEGTLKAATGDQITLDRAYMNLDEAMENFPGKTKEEVLYKFNRLYAFMRKAYETGDGTLRETPSGYEYLQNRLTNLNLGLSEEKSNELLFFAQDNTYASKEELSAGLRQIFPDGIDKKTMSSLITIIHSNQRFYQYPEEMEALINLLGCGKQITAEQARAVNTLLDNTDSILAAGNSNTRLTGLSLAKDCHDDDGEWQRVAVPEKEKKVEVSVVFDNLEPQPTPTIPTDIKFEEDEIEPVPLIQPVQVAKAPEPEPEPAPTPKIRKVVFDKFSDLQKDYIPGQEILDERQTAKMLRKFGQKSNG